jgi:hypothetical protein
MRIRLDDVELALGEDILNGGKAAIYEAARRLAREDGRVVVDILVDGGSVPDEGAFLALSGGLDIRFVTQPVRQLIPESIAEGERYIPILENGLESVATLLEGGKDNEALSRFAQCVEGIDWLMSVFEKCRFLLNVPADSFKCGNYDEFTGEFTRAQRDVLSSMEGGKNMRVAFLVRDEILPLISRFSMFWNEVKELADTPLQ